MKKCWYSDSSKRPFISEIANIINTWAFNFLALYARYFVLDEPKKQFEQAEEKRIELIKLKKLGPEFSEKPHSKAIFTSRPLNFLIFKSSHSSSMITFNTKQGMHCIEMFLKIKIIL